MAKEFIEREVAKARLRMWITDCVLDGDNEEADHYRACIDLLDSIPAADVVEVRHGRWVHNEDYEDWAEKYVCSECNRNAPSDGDYRHSLTDYCPHCGAKMDKEEKHEM